MQVDYHCQATGSPYATSPSFACISRTEHLGGSVAGEIDKQFQKGLPALQESSQVKQLLCIQVLKITEAYKDTPSCMSPCMMQMLSRFPALKSSKSNVRMPQVNHLDLLAEGKQVGGFLIYLWIERPDKREVVDEALDLLAKKIIAPSQGK